MKKIAMIVSALLLTTNLAFGLDSNIQMLLSITQRTLRQQPLQQMLCIMQALH